MFCIAKKYLLKFDSEEDLVKYLGSGFVASKFHVLLRRKRGKKKLRLILDLTRSGMSKRTEKSHRIVLPRISDAIHDALTLLSDVEHPQQLEWLVLDFEEAF